MNNHESGKDEILPRNSSAKQAICKCSNPATTKDAK